MSTLALDLGTKLGHAILRGDNRIESGTEDCAPRAKEGPGMRWVRFNRWIVEAKNVHDPITEVVYEEIVGQMPGQVYASQVYGGFVAVLQHFCERHAIPYRGINVSKVKKLWTGNGNANKTAMIARCKELGFLPTDDNEADAIALLHVALNRCPELSLETHLARVRRPKKNPDTASKSIPFDPF